MRTEPGSWTLNPELVPAQPERSDPGIEPVLKNGSGIGHVLADCHHRLPDRQDAHLFDRARRGCSGRWREPVPTRGSGEAAPRAGEVGNTGSARRTSREGSNVPAGTGGGSDGSVIRGTLAEIGEETGRRAPGIGTGVPATMTGGGVRYTGAGATPTGAGATIVNGRGGRGRGRDFLFVSNILEVPKPRESRPPGK